MIADPDARTNKGACPNPRAVLDVDGLGDEVKRGRFIIMIAGAKKSPLRNAHITFNHNWSEVQDPALLA